MPFKYTWDAIYAGRHLEVSKIATPSTVFVQEFIIYIRIFEPCRPCRAVQQSDGN